MRGKTFSLVLGISLTGGVLAGETPYNPNGNGQKADVQYAYFCHSDSADGKLYLTKPKAAFHGKYDGNLVANADIAFTDYMNTTYDRRSVRYPHCEFIPEAQVDGTYKGFITNADSQHRKVVNVDWEFAPLQTTP
jgi:hypothetical protein